MEDLLFGIDLGGTKIEAAVLNQQGEVLSRQRVPTEKEKGYDHIIGQIKKALSLVATAVDSQPKRLGIGTPGAIDPPTGLMKNSNTTILNGRPFEQDLQKALGIPVRMANDANCFAIAETLLGAAKSHTTKDHLVFGVIMGTGVGGGIVINGKVWDGGQGIGGEWGHSFLDASGVKDKLLYLSYSRCIEQIYFG